MPTLVRQSFFGHALPLQLGVSLTSQITSLDLCFPRICEMEVT